MGCLFSKGNNDDVPIQGGLETGSENPKPSAVISEDKEGISQEMKISSNLSPDEYEIRRNIFRWPVGEVELHMGPFTQTLMEIYVSEGFIYIYVVHSRTYEEKSQATHIPLKEGGALLSFLKTLGSSICKKNKE